MLSKWQHLFEADSLLRRLERAAKTGALEDWVRYRQASIIRGHGDPVKDPILVLFDNRDELKRRLGLPTKLPKDLEGDYSLEHDGRTYRFKVNKSRGPSGGTGSRMKMQCPMCGKYIGSAMTQYGHHLNARSHGGEPKKRSFRQLWPSIRSKLKKNSDKLGLSIFYSTWRQLVVVAPSSKKDAIVAFLGKEFPTLELHSDNQVEQAAYDSYQARGRPVNRTDRELLFTTIPVR